jgi:pyruvate formate lyase activating enzyme
MPAEKPSPVRRTDHAEHASSLESLRQPLAGDIPLSQVIDPIVREGELYERLPDGKVHCCACAHHCTINPGGRGICQVRYNLGGALYVPWGYVAALQCDPTEKKPFFHIHPGSDTLTFGMLGCDLHCSYCFPGDTVVITHRGPMQLEDAFRSASRFEVRPDAEIAYPDGLDAIASSGAQRKVKAVFKHPYRGQLTVIKPYYLPELRCTPDHPVYATTDVGREPQPIAASQLTKRHYLAIPRHSQPEDSSIVWNTVETLDYYLSPIRQVASTEYDGDVYNMEVEDEHNYLAGFFLVHNCQNWDISQAMRDSQAGRPPSQTTPEQLVALARRNGAKCVASSYNEPLITSEWAMAVFKQAKAAGFTCMYISNGNATREVLDYIRPYTDGYKIDLKTMNDKTYRKLGAPLQHILDGIRLVHGMGFWLEIVTLVIPGFNDSDDELRDAAQFIRSLSPDIPWHVTAFHKDYKMQDPDNTGARTLLRAAEIGRREGLRYVYAGNLPGQVGDYEHTYCPSCHALLIERLGYVILDYQLTDDGKCPRCNTSIPGIWPKSKAEVRTGTIADLFFRVPRRV